MGQAHSREPPTIESLNHQLTEAFATKCLSPLELYIFKAVFREHATKSSDVLYWTQETLAKFLGLPDHPGLPIAHVLFQIAGYIGAFPFPSQAPAFLSNDAILRVVVVLTGRHAKVLRSSRQSWEREIWRSLAVIDRTLSASEKPVHQKKQSEQVAAGFGVDEAIDDYGDDDDGLELAAFDAMDATEIYKQGERDHASQAMVPTDNFLTLIMFLLLIAPLSSQEPLSTYVGKLDDEMLQELRARAGAILTSFGVERHPGISYRLFRKVVTSALPNLFTPIRVLFENFLYSTDLKLSQKLPTDGEDTENSRPKHKIASRPLLPSPNGELLSHASLSELSFVLPSSTLFRNLTLLYSGSQDGFSMPTFQTSVFNWQAPSILLVSGSLIYERDASHAAKDFMARLPYRRFKSSVHASQTVTYAAYISLPWKQTHKASFGDRNTFLMSLTPQHDVFRAADATSCVYFNRHPSTFTGVGFGSPLAEENSSSAAHNTGHSRQQSDVKIPLGPVSLHMDDSLTFAVFTHDSRGGGTYSPSTLPRSCRLAPLDHSQSAGASAVPNLSSPVTSPPTSPLYHTTSPSRAGPVSTPLTDWQDVFEIESLEIYGLGGAEVADEQRRAHEWEERESERRRRINIGTGDIDADRELLKMAGLVGQGQSGGSMG